MFPKLGRKVMVEVCLCCVFEYVSDCFGKWLPNLWLFVFVEMFQTCLGSGFPIFDFLGGVLGLSVLAENS